MQEEKKHIFEQAGRAGKTLELESYIQPSIYCLTEVSTNLDSTKENVKWKKNEKIKW